MISVVQLDHIGYHRRHAPGTKFHLHASWRNNHAYFQKDPGGDQPYGGTVDHRLPTAAQLDLHPTVLQRPRRRLHGRPLPLPGCNMPNPCPPANNTIGSGTGWLRTTSPVTGNHWIESSRGWSAKCSIRIDRLMTITPAINDSVIAPTATRVLRSLLRFVKRTMIKNAASGKTGRSIVRVLVSIIPFLLPFH